jgi:hypothetical protein
MSGKKFVPQFAGDVDPSEFMEAMSGDIQTPPMMEAFRGMDEVQRVHEEAQTPPQEPQQAAQGTDVKEALRDWLKAGQKLLEAMEREGQS